MEIINRVQNSGLITIDLENYLPKANSLVGIDIREQLWQGMALKEKDFRAYIESHNWKQYEGKIVYIYCSEDAIIPSWAYMLLASRLIEYTPEVFFGTREAALESYLFKQINEMESSRYNDARIVIKGCADIPNINKIFTALTIKLRPYCKALMYGEPCSTVPIYKRAK
jgi:hypothetical protein